MMILSTLMLGSQILLAAASVPSFDVEPSCKVACNFGGSLRRDACIHTEKEAREQIEKGLERLCKRVT